MRIHVSRVAMDPSVIAPVIYGTYPHQTTNAAVMISAEVWSELRRFLACFNASVGVERVPYYRIDAYFNEESLWVLEINASFVDGWGTALNLARASNVFVDPAALRFPSRFATVDRAYQPELELFVQELSHRGIEGEIVSSWNTPTDHQVYVYGRVDAREQPHILPYDGLRLDNKLNLALVSRSWDGNAVRVPRHYCARFEGWDEIPEQVVLKFCDKGSADCARVRQSVLFNKPAGKSPFLKQCYVAETLLAQERIAPAQHEGRNCQLIIFAIGDEPITGYVQYSTSKIINDNSIHGPLVLM